MTDRFSDFKLRLFDRWASSYDWLFPSVFYQAIHQRLLETIHLPNRAFALDMGCGTGKLLDRLASSLPDLRAIGIDYSPNMIHQATQHNRYPQRINFQVGRAEALPFADHQFDAVFNTISFLHYPAPEAVLAEVYRVLLPGGYFYLADFSVRWATQPQIFGANPGSIRLYSPVARETLGRSAGFTRIKHDYLFGPVLLTMFQKQ
jgi:ubiquinone/menaquinone biosynthesis C-methylase UbiE